MKTGHGTGLGIGCIRLAWLKAGRWDRPVGAARRAPSWALGFAFVSDRLLHRRVDGTMSSPPGSPGWGSSASNRLHHGALGTADLVPEGVCAWIAPVSCEH